MYSTKLKILTLRKLHYLWILFLVDATIGLRITNMTAPTLQDPRKSMHLYCKFDMGGEDLYAVKWYKDDHEFFRYAPTGPNHYVQYSLTGVTVDTKKSVCTRETCELTLTGLHRPYSSGAYRCEVSSEAPAFRLASQTYNITVAAIPPEPPTIWGLIDTFKVGDLLQANCTSGLGDPQPRLTWYVNKQPVPSKSVKDLPAETARDQANERVVLKNTKSQLRLPLDKRMSGKGPSTTLEISCVATFDGINPNIAPPKQTVKSVLVVDDDQYVKNQKLKWLENSASIISGNFWPLLLIFYFLC